MSEVMGFVPASVLRVASQKGLDAERLCEGLGFRPGHLDDRGRVSWGDFATLLDRVLEALGPEGMEDVGACVCTGYSLYRQLAALFFDVRRLYEVATLEVPRRLYPGIVDSRLNWHSDGSVEGHWMGHAGYRVPAALGYASLGTYKTLPRHLGLPDAELISAHVGVQETRLHVMPPASRTLATRFRRLARKAERLIPSLIATAAHHDRAPGLHAEPVVPSEVAPARNVVPAREQGVQGGDGASRLGQKLDEAVAAWELTARQRQVLALVIEGLANKEIAARLECSVGTVENHLTALYRQARVDSRAALAAKFWGTRNSDARSGYAKGTCERLASDVARRRASV